MSEYNNLVIEPLANNHLRTNFTCGISSLDNYIKKQANQDIKRRISRVFVATTDDNSGTIVGYYTLSSLSIELGYLPEIISKKLPRHPIPAALIGRLAVDNCAQGYGVGKLLLADAVKRTLSVSSDIAIYAVVVDAINERILKFYERFGFIKFSGNGKRLFLPLKAI